MIGLIQGLIIGLIVVLPGMSGGTLFLIFGLYEKLMKDLAKLRLKPYITLGLGLVGGIYLGGLLFTALFENHRDFAATLLLGALLASVKPVVQSAPKPSKKGILFLLIGLALGFVLVSDDIGSLALHTTQVSWWLLLVGGALSTATMMVPGLPGSSILILLGIYDLMLYYIAELAISNLLIFGIGSLLGILLLANVLDKIYTNYRMLVSYLFVGLIIGSGRGLLPSYISPTIIILFLIGFIAVWFAADIPNKKLAKQ